MASVAAVWALIIWGGGGGGGGGLLSALILNPILKKKNMPRFNKPFAIIFYCTHGISNTIHMHTFATALQCYVKCDILHTGLQKYKWEQTSHLHSHRVVKYQIS